MPPSMISYVERVNQNKRSGDQISSHAPKRRKTAIFNSEENHFVTEQTVENGRKDSTEDLDESQFISPIDEGALPSHPRGVKPLGNLYSSSDRNIKTRSGSFASLPDEVLLYVLEYLEARHLLHLAATCKALYAFTCHDELWKTLLAESPLSSLQHNQRLQWRGTWRETYLSLPSDRATSVDCSGLYSDALYRPFQCAHLSLDRYTDPERFRSPIPKLPYLSPDEFQAHWSNKPFILTEPVKSWRAYHDWDVTKLRDRYGGSVFRCEAVDWPMESYLQYMRENDDESPLYLFDSRFVEKMDLRIGDPSSVAAPEESNCDYTPPETFFPDLFNVLGTERPSHRWLIMGPARSGSSFHLDPNGTSAWNAVIKGRKYWFMCPKPPPGVYVSEDESEVTSPTSIAEWLLTFHDEARRMPGCREGICEEGEVLHVPGGWYHMVLNLPSALGNPDNIAITQNFVPESRLSTVLAFLRDKPEQVSGFQFSDDNQHDLLLRRDESKFSAYDLFVERLKEKYPALLEAALKSIDKIEESTGRNSAWQRALKEKEGVSFSFGFGSDDEEEMP